MEIVRIGQGFEPPHGDYCGVRIKEGGVSKLEVRLSGTAAAVINANINIYGEVFDWVEQVAINIYSTGEVEEYETIMIDSRYVNEKSYVIKNWKLFVKE